MIKKLTELAQNLKISDFGIVRARVFDDLCLDLHTANSSEFVSAAPEERSNPFLIMPDAKSLIVCLFNYNCGRTGNISKYAMGEDYHSVIKKKLAAFAEPLRAAGFDCMEFSDSWSMNERYLAACAGLGFVGKNRMFISRKFGSYVFIGTIITNCELEPSEAAKSSCAGCNMCIKSCPGGALSEDRGFNESRCLSYITQKKGELEPWETELIRKGKSAWGCDICQEVCPHNKNAPCTDIEEFSNNLISGLNIDEDMSNKEFKRAYSNRAFSWRGKAPLVRNLKILKKQRKSEKTVENGLT